MTNEMTNEYEIYLKTDIPVLLWGPPGVGKTASILNLAQKNNVHCEVIIGSIMDPTDLGHPIVSGGCITLSPPPWARRIRTALDNGQEAWLFIDELTCAPPSIQAALLRVVNERAVGDMSIAGVKIIGAANPSEHAADGIELSSAMSNRWAHVNWTLSSDDWIAGEVSGWGSPDSALSYARGLITSWIGTSPKSLLDPPTDGQENVMGWPSPRSWSNVIRAISGFENIETKQLKKIVSALCGHAAAVEIAAWHADNDIPSAEDLLCGRVKLPERGDLAYLSLQACLSYSINTGTMDPYWKLLKTARKDLAISQAMTAISAAESAGLTIDDSEELNDISRSMKEI